MLGLKLGSQTGKAVEGNGGTVRQMCAAKVPPAPMTEMGPNSEVPAKTGQTTNVRNATKADLLSPTQ